MVTKHIAYVDRDWGHVEDHSVHGDMGYSICDCADTRTEEIDELKENCRDYALGDGAVDGDDVFDNETGHFAIYEIVEADIELDEDDSYLWSGDVIDGTKKIVEVYACATEEVAGWIKEVEYFKNVNVFKFRED